MKKIVFVVLGALVLYVLYFLISSFFKIQSLDQRHVNIKPGKEERIVLVNLGNGDRAYIAERINEVATCNPSIIAIDFYFKQYSKENTEDSLLLASISNTDCILATRHKGIGTQGVDKNFLNASKNYGYAELNAVDGYVSNYEVFWDINGKKDYHFAYATANEIDPVQANRFINSLDGNISDIVISRLTSQFKIFDFEEKITCEDINDKIVLIGYIGPTLEDKLDTYAKYHDESDDKGPDMYGPVVVANQILMILDYE